jgi:plastocyanin
LKFEVNLILIIFYDLEKDILRKGGIEMFVKKRFIRMVVLLAIMVGISATGSLSVLAQISTLTQPIESVKAIEVELHDDYFNPKVISIPNGKPTTLLLKNKGRKEHTFTVEKLNIDVEIQAGKEKTITVRPTSSGTYDLVCRYHLQEGMVGKVIVN